jgi:hypothetical protein
MENQLPQSNAGFQSEELSTEMSDCIKNCLDCFEVCSKAAVYYLSMDSRPKALHVQLMQACAEICKTSASFMILHSPFHQKTCAVCAEVCQACAEDCDHFDDAFMRDCAKICRECAASCRTMATGKH